MEYYGNLNNKRLRVCETYDIEEITDVTKAVGFINSKGMLFDYALKQYNEGYMHRHTKDFSGNIHPCDDVNPWIMFSDCWLGMKKIKRNGTIYYVGEFKWNKKEYGVLMELPRIGDDSVFTWKTNKRYGTLEATIKKENFEYLCIVKADGNAFVEVKYTKQDNKHRNNVTMARINVYNASNQDILDAIKKWQAEMIACLNMSERR